MTKFHEGQEVEVAEIRGDPRPFRVWRKAKIARAWLDNNKIDTRGVPNRWYVRFQDGSRAVFDAEHIRAIKTEDEKTAERMAVFQKMYHGS